MNGRRVRILTPVFFERYFDSEFAAGAASLKTSFFWLVAILAMPGIVMPVLMSPSWYFVGQYYGLDQLDAIVRADKVLYLGYSAWAIGMVSMLTWNAMLLDRRDGLVLGSLPLEGREVIAAKTSALFMYAALLMVAMHTGAAVMFGLFLGNVRSVLSAIATTLAAFTATSLCSLFVVFSIVAVQGITLLAVGGRRFTSLSPFLQLGIVALLLTSGTYVPGITTAVTDTLAGSGANNAPWILKTPILWYLGVYEVLLGHRDPQLLSLAASGIVNLVVVMTLAVVALPLSYARVMTAAVEQAARSRRRGLVTALLGIVARLLSRRPQRRAAMEFFLLSIARHSRPRLAMALAIGAAVAWTGPAIAVELGRDVSAVPPAAVLGAPLAAIVLLVAGLRVAASLPSELPPRWLFAALARSDADARSAMRRLAAAIGVVLPAAIAAAAMTARWSGSVAAVHFAVCVSTGLLLVELAFRDFTGMPCARVWRPDGAELRAWWPAYLGGFLLIVAGLPQVELFLAGDDLATAGLVSAPIIAAAMIRFSDRHREVAIETEDDEPAAVQLLNL